MLKKFKVFRSFSIELKNQNISSYAAGAAFFIFLSLIPIVMILFSMLPYTPVSKAQAIELILDIFPPALGSLFQTIISEFYEKSVTLISVSAVVIIWAAAKGTLALTYGLNALNDVIETRNYFFMRLVASFETLIMLIAIIVSLVLMVFGNVLVKLILKDLPAIAQVYQFALKFRFLFSWGMLTIIFATLYTFFPNKKMKWKKQIPGAVFTAVLWSVFSWAFSIYVEYNGFTMYGSLATIVIIMIWMYTCLYIFFLGAYLNRTFRTTILEFFAAFNEEDDDEAQNLKEIIRTKDIKAGKSS